MPQPSAMLKESFNHAVAGLIQACGLSAASAESLRELIGSTERYPAGSLVSSMSPAPRLKWTLSGCGCELRVLPDGRRQIFSFVLPGDPFLSRPVNAANPCEVIALTNLECIDVALTLDGADGSDRAEILKAIDRALALAHARRYEDIVRLARRSALERVAELLLEMHDRLHQIGMVDERGFHLPLTQEHLADALGLSVVHVNRSLKALRTHGLATFRFGRVSDLDRAGLRALCPA